MPRGNIAHILVLTALGIASLLLAIMALLAAALFTDHALILIGAAVSVLIADKVLTQYVISGGPSSKRGGSVHWGSVLILWASFTWQS